MVERGHHHEPRPTEEDRRPMGVSHHRHHHGALYALIALAMGVWWAGYQMLKWFVLLWWYLAKWSVLGPVRLVQWGSRCAGG